METGIMNKVGFIGLGILGVPMAEHIIDGGYQLNAHTRSGVPQRLIDKGAITNNAHFDAKDN